MATIRQYDQLVEYHDHWLVPLQGKMVTRCLVDSAFGIELWDGDSTTTIRIEGSFIFREHGTDQLLSPEHPTALGPVLATVGKTVTAVHACKNGRLEVHFADGSSLSVEPDAEYEAWEIVSSGGLRVVCTPGGSVSIWQPGKENDGL